MSQIQKVRPRMAAEIESAAERVIRRFQGEVLKQIKPFDVVRFFDCDLRDDTDIEGDYRDLPDGIEGFTDVGLSVCIISTSLYGHDDDDVTRRRLRSTIAHEIGHCYLHAPDARKDPNQVSRFENDGTHAYELFDPNDLKIYENPEWQAWRFADALLMPAVTFRAAIAKKWNKNQLKNGFDVNPSYIDKRIKELRIPTLIPKG